MTTSPVLGVPYVASQQAQPEVTHNEAVAVLTALQRGAISRGLNAPPGGPDDGDSYIVGTSPTGAWAGRANCVAVYVTNAWRFVPGDDGDGGAIAMGADQAGMALYVQAEGGFALWSGSAWAAGGGAAHDVAFGFETAPSAAAVIHRERAARAIAFKADFAGAQGGVGTNPGAEFTLSVKKNAVEIGTVTVSTGGAVSFATDGAAAQALAAGDELTVEAPAGSPAEATVAEGSFVLPGVTG